MFYIEYVYGNGKIQCNYNGRDVYYDALSHFRRSGRVIISHGRVG